MSYHHETNTMDVIIDGHPSVRTVDHIETFGRLGHRYQPELKEDEECVWYIGSDVPVIVKVR